MTRLTGLDGLTERLAAATSAWGREVVVDVPSLLEERARLRGLSPRGRLSHGGATRLMRCVDGWIAVTLARPGDAELLPAWRGLLGCPPLGGAEPWDDVRCLVASASGADLAATAELLGLAVGVLGERCRDGDAVEVRTFGHATQRTGALRVLDLTALWAGPLCCSLLAQAGADVTKIEAVGRPDGARVGDPALYRRLNEAKRVLEVDLTTCRGRAALAGAVAASDVVVTAARPRALAQLGLEPEAWVRGGRGPSVWVAITGHGATSNRIAYGDDAAVAGGLVSCDGDGPTFLGDAIADPLTGIAAATAAAEALATGGRVVLDIAMSRVAASVVAV